MTIISSEKIDSTMTEIEAHRAADPNDVLVTRDGWSVSYMSGVGGVYAVQLSCVRYEPGRVMRVVETDPADGQIFASIERAQAYALEAGRLQWMSEAKAAKLATCAAEGHRLDTEVEGLCSRCWQRVSP